MLDLVTAPETLAQPTLAHRFMVELASTETELDAQGVPVPKEYKTIDVVLLEPTKQAIKTLIAATDWLKGWTMVSHWVPEDDCNCF